MPDRYEFDDDSYQALAASGVPWQEALYVLHSTDRTWRGHRGDLLRIAGRDRQGRWLGLVLVETQDDMYVLTGARYLDEDEAEAIERLWRR
jgi:hypothetical protein